MLNSSQLNILFRYFPGLTESQVRKFEQIQEVYEHWNDKINVISRKDIGALYEHHVLHSLAIAKFIQFTPGSLILDVGTGGGFPGIPLAILFPQCKFYLADSIAKKIHVVEAVKSHLNLENVYPISLRAEKIEATFDFIVSRAVTAFPAFYNMVRQKIHAVQTNEMRNGIIYLKGGDFSEEVQKFKNRVKIVEISDYFDEDFFKTKRIIYLPV